MPTLQLLFTSSGFVLMYMAWSLWTEKPSNIEEIEPMSAKKQILFALSVSLLNPHAIMDTVGVIGTSASVYDGYDKVVFIGYNFCILDLVCLLAILGRITGKIDKSGKYIVILNKVSSVIVIIVGLIILKILLEF